MAVTYDKIAYDEVELGLKSILSEEFTNVYIGNTFKMLGSTSIEQATNYE